MAGEEHNLSWNCGTPEEEGDLALPATVDLRTRQYRNHLVALMVHTLARASMCLEAPLLERRFQTLHVPLLRLMRARHTAP